ncbi:MAG: ATP-binding cassette domain-containing protein [archaeon]
MSISVKNLRKVYKTHSREPGLLNAIKSLFIRKYETKVALDNVSFEIEDGEVVGLIGPNGAGKSTTIKAMCGILYPTSGEVNVLGFDPWKERIKYVKNIGVVFGQKSQLWWDLPAKDSFLFTKDVFRVKKRAYEKRLKYMLKILDIEDVSKTPVRDMSLGERMKCELVVALIHNPKLVFLDEPSIGLDLIAKDRLREYVKFANKKYGTTFIVTTHDMQDIESLCKRVIIVNHGKVIYDGPLADIKKKIMAKKFISVKFDEKVRKKFKLKGCDVEKPNPFELKIEVDLKKQKLKTVIDYLIAEFDFVDLFISDPPIEDIIKILYEK